MHAYISDGNRRTGGKDVESLWEDPNSTENQENRLCPEAVQVSSVQFSSRWYICGWESSYVLHPFSQKFPQHCHWNSLNISMTSQTFFAVRVKWQFITLNACTATRQCEQMLCHTCGRKDVCSSQMSVNFAFISTHVCFRGWQLLKLQWLWQSHVIGRCQPV